MLNFWDRLWLAKAVVIHDFFEEQRKQQEKWDDFCRNCISEILQESSHIVETVLEATKKQSGSRIHKDLAEGVVYLPLYGFYIVLGGQKQASKEQSHVLQLFFRNFDMPFSMNLFIDATKRDNHARKVLLEKVCITRAYAGSFWVQFFKVLYRTEQDESFVSEVVESFANVTMRFAALSGQTEKYVLEILKEFVENVSEQSVLCRSVPDDKVDFYGDVPFLEHFSRFKSETLKICSYTMDEDDEEFNPRIFFRSFAMGIIYQVVRRSRRNRRDKIMIMEDILSKCNIEGSADGEYIFKYMEDLHGEQTTMVAEMMHIYTDIDKGAMGWIILMRASGTYNLDKNKPVDAIEEASNFLIGMDNYLEDTYPMSGFGTIAQDYLNQAFKLVSRDMDENMTFV